jgi:LemA protein
MSALYIILIVLAVIVLWVVASYNSFVRLVNRAKEAWADIEVQLKRRYDLIPNLINTVKGYAGHESATLEKVTAARVSAMSAQSTADHAKAEGELAARP